ncbi:type II toxin-antitoxin system MqsR family toxin [Inediibacterium massiliense]|uniref:type II toxin-antitoxin system MqsR family toxin n=1 Tax=Inediibacterium massiliense TaxID=1658111 RepID=UPI0006B5941C|nr:type II toxin-antitoxin system MqsR family toxin [Inediibacterium massiliense]
MITGSWIEDPESVEAFLVEMKNRIQDSYENVKIIKRMRSEDKTFNFQVQYGLTHEIICKELLKLDISNYCYTDNDYDSKRGGVVWIFGQTLIYPGIYSYPEVYIKLKLNSKVICLSFHEKEYPLEYPYN